MEAPFSYCHWGAIQQYLDIGKYGVTPKQVGESPRIEALILRALPNSEFFRWWGNFKYRGKVVAKKLYVQQRADEMVVTNSIRILIKLG